MVHSKKKEPDEEVSISKTLDEIIELKKAENSALKKIFESLKKPNKKK